MQWDARRVDPDHALYHSRGSLGVSPLEAWEDLGGSGCDPKQARRDWAALAAWAQLRVLDRLDRGSLLVPLPQGVLTELKAGEPSGPENVCVYVPDACSWYLTRNSTHRPC